MVPQRHRVRLRAPGSRGGMPRQRRRRRLRDRRRRPGRAAM